MPIAYLLPAQTLLDLCNPSPTPVQNWARAVRKTEYGVSAIAVAQAGAAIDTMSNAQDRAALKMRFAGLLAQIFNDSGPPLPFDGVAIPYWQGLINDPPLDGKVTQIKRQEYAIALAHHLTVVEASAGHHSYLLGRGILIHSL